MNLGLSKKSTHKAHPVTSLENLRGRVERLLLRSSKQSTRSEQLALDLPSTLRQEDSINLPRKDVVSFLNFLSDALPDGDVYLFGGVLRDLALLGGKGFNSDIDVVVEGDWSSCTKYLDHVGAHRNKFGGYRLEVASWKVDVWSAKETWAIKQGLVPYKGIASLTETTVLNWDAILMNWRTRAFIFRPGYFDEIHRRVLDIVLEQNPDPEGMVVRVFRHLSLKEAKSFTPKALAFLADATVIYTMQTLIERELRSYGSSVIEPGMYRFFQHVKANEHLEFERRIEVARELTKSEFGEIPLVG